MGEKKKCGGKFFLGAALGAIAGAVAGIVMAPKSGEETRKDIKNATDKTVKDVKEKGGSFFKKAKKSVEDAGKTISEKVKKPEEKVEEPKKTEKVEKKEEKKD